MKYFFISDIHGQYGKMLNALTQAGFNKEKDTIVSLGDPFDRGDKSKEVLNYLMSCPNRILVWGNHDWRLKNLMIGKGWFQDYDFHNGVPATLCSLTGRKPYDSDVGTMRLLLNTDVRYKEIGSKLYQYFNECVCAVEFKDLVGCHAWVPYYILATKQVYGMPTEETLMLNSDWRHAVSEEWYESTWANTEQCLKNGIFIEKNMIVGHWHAWRIAIQFGGESRVIKPGATKTEIPTLDCSSYTLKTSTGTTITFIDGCTNIPSGKVNVFIYETDEEPHLITPSRIETVNI